MFNINKITMAHNINIKPNGQASFVSRKEVPWHKLGHVVQTLYAEEAIQLGGLDFDVEKRPLYSPSIDMSFEDAKQYPMIQRTLIKPEDKLIPMYNKLFTVKDKYAIVRKDNDVPLGIVGSKYTPVQNIEAFKFFDDIAQDGIAQYETAGCLGNGEIVFVTAKVTESMTIHNDQIDKYLLISLSHDGTSAITVMYTPVRVVCNNTLTLALKDAVNKVQIRHTQSALDKLNAAKATLGLITKGDIKHMEYFERLLNVQVTEGEIIDIMARAYKIDTDNLSSKGKNILETNLDYYYKGLGQKDFIGTGWGAYNAITGYLQNVKSYTDSDVKFKSTLLTGQQTIRNQVYNDLILL